jgi:response regulator NasT
MRRSNPDFAMTFMTLPPPRATPATSGPAAPTALPKRILVADDEHLIAQMLVDQLVSLGCEPIGPASTGEQAIQLARTERPDLALLDIRMPQLDGLAAARGIWVELGIPVVIISAYSEPESIAGGEDLGVFGYLIKPINAEDLRVAIAVAWRRWHAHLTQTSRIRQLEKSLDARRAVEQAKWMLVKALSIEEPEAHRRLQDHARRERAPIAAIAQKIIEGTIDLAKLP